MWDLVKLAPVYAGAISSVVLAQDGGKLWATAVATRPTDNHKMIFRYIAEFKPGFDQLEFPERVTLEWPYESDSGLPAKVDMRAMDDFEDQFAVKLRGHDQLVASLAIVSTGEGYRRWTYYAKSGAAFYADLNSVGAGVKVPVLSHVDHDPDWTMYKTFVSGIHR